MIKNNFQNNADSRYVQFYSIFTLQNKQYEGHVPFSEVSSHGDLGIGTFNHIDGEMVIVDGDVYRLRADGSAQRVDDLSESTPYAIVTQFRATQGAEVNGDFTMPELLQRLDVLIQKPAEIHAVRVEGRFDSIRTRAPHRQTPPYKGLLDLIKEQNETSFRNIQGTLVGFYTPEYLGILGVPGYHLHFIDKDRRHGGHVQDFLLTEATLAVQLMQHITVFSPGGNDARGD